MHVVLVTFKADGERRSFSLPRDVTVIGRREDSDLRIPLGEVSRKHCRFIMDGQTLRLEDLGSSNGTFHNGARVQEAVIQPGDIVQVGPVTFMIQIDGVPSDSEIQPATSAAASQDTRVGESAPGAMAAVPAAPSAPPAAAAIPASESQVIDLDAFTAADDADAPSLPMELDFVDAPPEPNPPPAP